jgi:hypothetical protein
MAKAEKKIVDTSKQLVDLDAALREHGHSIPDLLVHAAKQAYGVDLVRVIHPVEEVK